MNYYLNPDYKLKKDQGKVLILFKETYRGGKYGGQEGFMGSVHPFYAILLSFINGNDLESIYSDFSNYLDLPDSFKPLIIKQIKQLIQNETTIGLKYNNFPSAFPSNIIIESNQDIKNDLYDPDEFLDLIGNDFNPTLRHNTPSIITINFTMRCRTDCIYCYADRQKEMYKNHVPIERYHEILEEAKKLGVVSLDVIGGEFFMYKHWDKILEKCYALGYNPYLSTKIPLKEKMIQKLASLGAKDIQISLDTMIQENLTKVLRVNERYLEEIKNTFYLLEKYQFTVNVHTIITNDNSSIKDIESLYDFLISFKNIEKWKIDAAEHSMYSDISYKEYSADKNDILKLQEYVHEKNINPLHTFQFLPPELFTPPASMSTDQRKDFFENRAACSGNLSSLYILPDGKVTICEELYWNPNFILGDIKTQSLQEVWNSGKAKKLYHLDQKALSKDSPCHSCGYFDQCRTDRQICWKHTVRVLGSDKWDYPDIFCLKSPDFETSNFFTKV